MWTEKDVLGREVGVSGMILSFAYIYNDGISRPGTFSETQRVPYPIDTFGYQGTIHPANIYNNSDAKAKCEHYSKEIKEKRITSLNNLLTPIQHSTQVWINISQGLESRVM